MTDTLRTLTAPSDAVSSETTVSSSPDIAGLETGPTGTAPRPAWLDLAEAMLREMRDRKPRQRADSNDLDDEDDLFVDDILGGDAEQGSSTADGDTAQANDAARAGDTNTPRRRPSGAARGGTREGSRGGIRHHAQDGGDGPRDGSRVGA